MIEQVISYLKHNPKVAITWFNDNDMESHPAKFPFMVIMVISVWCSAARYKNSCKSPLHQGI